MGNFSKLIQSKSPKKQDLGQNNVQKHSAQITDNRAENALQLKLSEIANSGKGKDAVQRVGSEEEKLQLKGIDQENDLQLKGLDEDELQMKSIEDGEEIQMKTIDSSLTPTSDLRKDGFTPNGVRNNTGLPSQLKSGVENLSGYSLDDVKVHYNSDKPAQLNAHAYAQGTDIHLASGQEKHLPHEAWHVVQQKQRRVKPTRQLKGKIDVNDDAVLETEADVMGSKALHTTSESNSRIKSISGKTGLSALKTNQLLIQRNEESAEVLKDLAEPRVGQQDIELSQEIHQKLEEIYTNIIEKEESFNDMRKLTYNGAVCLGGIVLPPIADKDNLTDLFLKTDLVNLGKGSVGLGIYELLPKDLKNMILYNTLATMADAGQLDYLMKSDFGSSKNSQWKVVVEIHYYRERASTDNVFHKDTLGKTLFVNLNYLNSKKIVGPEYVLNPQDSPEHLANIAKTLPKEFLKDRKTVMGELDEPQIIEVVEIPEYGYVAFVDETIHHSSPTTQHRKVKGQEIHDFMLGEDKKLYKIYKKAYDNWTNRSAKKQQKTYSDFLKKKYRTEANDWFSFFDNNNPNSTYDRNEIRLMDPNRKFLSDDKVDEILHLANYRNFGEASIPDPGNPSIKSPLTKGNKPLKRRMSVNLDSKTMGTSDKEVGGRRSFFRTWVRAEKIGDQVTRDDWKWTDRGNK